MSTHLKHHTAAERPHLKTHHKTLAWVLAAVNEMIEESIYHCQTFAHALRTHHNSAAAEVFESLLPHLKAEQHFVLDKLNGMKLPSIPPWEIPHPEYEHPAMHLFNAHYEMTSDQAWSLVQSLLKVHSCFYNHLQESLQQDEIQQLLHSLQKHGQAWRNQCAAQSANATPNR